MGYGYGFCVLLLVSAVLCYAEAQATPCSPNPCKRDCRCYESCQHAGGYYCRSGSGYLGKNCTVPMPTLRCEVDKIFFSVSESFVDEYDLGLKNSFINVAPSLDSSLKCEVSRATNGFYEIEIPLPFTSCGMETTTTDGSVVVGNQVWFNRRLSNSMFDMPIPVAEMKCQYDREYKVVTALRPVVGQPAVLTDRNVIAPTISLCKVPECPSACPENYSVKGGAVYTVGETIHVSMSLDSGEDVTGVEEMYLSCSSSFSGANTVGIVEKGCVTSSGLPTEIRTNAASHVVCVSFQTPKSFSCDEFYIHAKLQSCGVNTAVMCDDGNGIKCPFSRKRRSLEPVPIVLGPIIMFNGSAGLPIVRIHGMEIDEVAEIDLTKLSKIRRDNQAEILPALSTRYSSLGLDNTVAIVVIVTSVIFLVLSVLLLLFIRNRSVDQKSRICLSK